MLPSLRAIRTSAVVSASRHAFSSRLCAAHGRIPCPSAGERYWFKARCPLTASVWLASLLVVCAPGCVRCLHPIYTGPDVVFRDSLVGTWQQAGQQMQLQFTPADSADQNRAYQLVFTDNRDRVRRFVAHLVTLDEELYLDLYPTAPPAMNDAFYKYYFQRLHTFLRIELDEHRLTFASLNPSWLETHLIENPHALPHAAVPRTDETPPIRKRSPAERLILTASTTELQSFLRKHRDTEDAFTDAVEFLRTKE